MERLELLKKEDMYQWQNRLFTELTETEPNDYDIKWIWEETGGSGKSVFTKLLVTNYGAIITSGKASDAKHLIVKYHKKNGRWPEIVIFDIPRSNIRYLSYPGIEDIKNGLFVYKGGMVLMPSPHIVVFANTPPKRHNMSEDRWVVKELKESDKIQF